MASPDLEMAESGADVPIVCVVDLGMYRLNFWERGGPTVWREPAGLELASRAFIFGCYYFWELPDFLIGFSTGSWWSKLLCKGVGSKGPRVCILRGFAPLSSFTLPHIPATARRPLGSNSHPSLKSPSSQHLVPLSGYACVILYSLSSARPLSHLVGLPFPSSITPPC